MRILVICQFFPPDITAAAFRMGDTVRLLRAAGHEVRVITARPHRTQVAEDATQAAAREQGVLRAPLLAQGEGGALRYILHYSSFMVMAALQGLRLPFSGWRPDAIWCSSPPLFVAMSGKFLSLVMRRPLVLDIRDIWPESAVAAGQLSAGGRAFKIGKWMEGVAYRAARRLTCVSQPMQQYLLGLSGKPVAVIYNGIDGGLLRQHAMPAPEKLEHSIVYAGNLGRLQGLDGLLKAAAQLRAAGQLGDWRVRLIGAGALRDELQALVRELQLEGVASVEPPVAHAEAMRQMAGGGLLFMSLKSDPILERTIPSKLFDYLACARPIVAGIKGEGQEILHQTGANLCYPPDDIPALAAALAAGIARHAELSAKATANRELVLSRFTREVGVATLVQELAAAQVSGK